MEDIKENIQKMPAVIDELHDRKKKVLDFLKKRGQWIYYSILAFIVFIGVYVRTLNISKLKDVTTGTWTLGPDLDPFLFLRWAKYIAENGSLFLLDKMRSVPLAEFCSGVQCNPVNTSIEMKLLSYMIAGLYKFLSIFKEISVTYAAVIFPVIMFALTIIAFFLFARKVFYKKDEKSRNIIALISTAFFALIPSLLARTIAGIPEKESAAFFFIFIGFYFFMEAFTSEKLKRGLIFGMLAGLSTGILALVWGGAVYVFMTISGAVLFAFLLGKIDYKRFFSFGLWVLSSTLLMALFSARYPISNLLSSTSTGIACMILFVLGVDLLIFEKKIFKLDEKIRKIKIPEKIISLLIGVLILAIIGTLVFGISFIPHKVEDVISQTINPLSQGRFSVTVAENKQPYFIGDWEEEFGPVYAGIPLFFWLFFAGSIFLFAQLIKGLEKKERWILIASYLIFLLGLIFSKYSSSGVLNGTSALSMIVYFGGVIVFLGSFTYVYLKRYKENKLSAFKEFDFSYLLYFVILTMTIIGARGALRLIMVLAAVSPVVVGFLVFKFPSDCFREKDKTKKIITGILALIVIVAAVLTLVYYYNSDKSMGANYAPSSYQWQWQKAMAWVRDNTAEDSVFAHWWDYGYWVQSIGERATILDGGNAIGYWNYFMGRHVLTGSDEKTALEFLYTHNATHLLIDSTDIGKYTAFSSIGSDENYDRFSWINTYLMDESQTLETNNQTIYVYTGGSTNDEDIVWSENGEEVFLPRKKALVAAIIVRETPSKEILQPEIIFLYQNTQYRIPLKSIYIRDKLYEFSNGIDAGIFIFPQVSTNSEGNLRANEIGAGLYLGTRVIHTNLARLYLFGLDTDYFKTAHTESSIFVSDLKDKGFYMGEFLYYDGIYGPIKIWEVKYPLDIKMNPEYLETDYPLELAGVNPDEYG